MLYHLTEVWLAPIECQDAVPSRGHKVVSLVGLVVSYSLAALLHPLYSSEIETQKEVGLYCESINSSAATSLCVLVVCDLYS